MQHDGAIVVGLNLGGSLVLLRCKRVLTTSGPVLGEPVMRMEMPRIECDCTLEGLLCCFEVANQLQGVAAGHVGVRKIGCELDSSLACRHCICGCNARNILPLPKQLHERVRESRVRVSERRIHADRFTEQLDSRAQLGFLLSIEQLAPAQVVLVRGGVLRAAALEA